MDHSNLLLPGEALTIATRRLGFDDISIEQVLISPIGSGMTGFMGDHLKIQIVVSDNRLGHMYELHMFAKSMPTASQEHMEYVLSFGAYDKEVVAYTNILPKLKDCLASRFRWSCECFLTRPDLIVLEDLTRLGFELHNNLKCMDNTHIVLVLTNLARLHAASLIFEERHSKIDDAFKDVMFENLFSSTEGSSSYNWFMTGINTAVHLTKYIRKYSEKPNLICEIKRDLPDVCKLMWEFVKPSKKFRNVLCHGDLWNNNIMFLYEKQRPVELRFVDFQMFRYIPPVAEVLFFLHMTTRRAYREAHLEDFLAFYYDTLNHQLQLKGYEGGRLLPWTELRASLEEYRNMGRIVAVILYQMCLMDSEIIKPLTTSVGKFRQVLEQDRRQEVEESLRRNPIYKARLLEALEELIECTILKKYGN